MDQLEGEHAGALRRIILEHLAFVAAGNDIPAPMEEVITQTMRYGGELTECVPFIAGQINNTGNYAIHELSKETGGMATEIVMLMWAKEDERLIEIQNHTIPESTPNPFPVLPKEWQRNASEIQRLIDLAVSYDFEGADRSQAIQGQKDEIVRRNVQRLSKLKQLQDHLRILSATSHTIEAK